MGSVAKFFWYMDRKRLANRLWRLLTFFFLTEGVVHDRNNGNFIMSKELHAGEPCHRNSPKVRMNGGFSLEKAASFCPTLAASPTWPMLPASDLMRKPLSGDLVEPGAASASGFARSRQTKSPLGATEIGRSCELLPLILVPLSIGRWRNGDGFGHRTREWVPRFYRLR